MSIAQQRQAAVGDTIQSIKEIVASGGVTRESLASVLGQVEQLAAKPHLWAQSEFAPPEEGERQARYLIAEDPDQTFALYLNVMRPGKRIPPHDHTTWACVAGVVGTEYNDVYLRTDDGSEPGVGTLKHSHTVEVGPSRLPASLMVSSERPIMNQVPSSRRSARSPCTQMPGTVRQ